MILLVELFNCAPSVEMSSPTKIKRIHDVGYSSKNNEYDI